MDGQEEVCVDVVLDVCVPMLAGCSVTDGNAVRCVTCSRNFVSS